MRPCHPYSACLSLSVTPNPRVTYKLYHEDDDVLVVGKPHGLVTQPGKGHDTDTLLNGLFEKYSKPLQNLGGARDFGLLHRLDRQASGLLLVALRPRAYDTLRTAFERKQIAKFYWAICAKAPREGVSVLNRPILESEPRAGSRETKTARVDSRGKASSTALRVLASSPKGALVEARPLTGRLHQVRVHLDSIACTILGDDVYGPRHLRMASPRLALHAHRLVFAHPADGRTIDIRTPFPRDLRPILTRLGLQRPDAPDAEGASPPDGTAAGE